MELLETCLAKSVIYIEYKKPKLYAVGTAILLSFEIGVTLIVPYFRHYDITGDIVVLRGIDGRGHF